MNLEELIVPISADTSGLQKGMDEAKNSASDLVSGLSDIGGGVVAGALGVAGAGIAGLTGLLYQSTQGAMEAESIQADLNATLESTRGVSGMTADSINDLSTALSEVTRFEDDVITSGSNMLLTFTNIGKDVFPMATEAMLNMAQKMGKQPVDMAVMLGKALNDPAEGLSALTRNGVVFTEQQKEQIKAMQEAGDMAGAQQIILKELSVEFGGVARAAGETAAGKMDIFWNKIGNIKDSIGNEMIPVMMTLADTASTMLSNPAVIAGIETFVNWVAIFAQTVITNIPVVIEFLQGLANWLSNNEGIIVGVLAALAVAATAWGVTTAIAVWTALSPMLPVIAVLALVGLAAYALYEAWTNNFMGIQDKMKAVWDYLLPIFITIRDWLAVNLPIAIQAISDYWTDTLLPAIKVVGAWIEEHLMPLFRALAEFVEVYLTIAFKGLVDMFNTLWPVIQDYLVWAFGNLMSIIRPIAEFIGNNLAWQFANLTSIIDGVTWAIQGVVAWLDRLNGASVNVNANVNSNIGTNIGNRAVGGMLMPGQTTWVGESGPEIITAGKGGGYVTPNNMVGSNDEIGILLKELIGAQLSERSLARALRDAMLQGGN